MSFIVRRALRLHTPTTSTLAQTRFYADKKMDSAGDALKSAGKALQGDGSIGSKFERDGEIGQIGDKIGGPFSGDGAIGHQFTSDGAIGGTGQKVAESVEQAGKNTKAEA
ncbi:hypothetical protein Q5752_003522 [Cryptotrichosporon argae]